MHMVTCVHCREKFDRDKQPFVEVSTRRYAHPDCHKKHKIVYEQNKQELQELEEYIKQLFQIETISVRIRKQMNDYVNNHHYTYSGILRALTYFYGVQGHSIEKANGGIGIVPYTYDAAHNYYQAIWLANQKNADKTVSEYIPKEEMTVLISAPKKKPLKKKAFSFLLEGSNEE